MTLGRRKFLAGLLCSAAVIASVVPAKAAVAFVNYTDGGSVAGVTSITATAANHTTGNCNVVLVSRASAQAVTVTDTAGNTYTQAGTDFLKGIHYLALFYCYNITGNASNVVTVTIASGTGAYFTAAVYQFSGMGTTALVGTNQTATGTSTSPQTAALAPTNPSGVILDIVECDTPGAFSAGSGFAGNTNSVSGLNYFFTEYKIVSVSTVPICTSGNDAWGMLAGIFNGPAASGTPHGMTLGTGFH